MVTAAPTTGSVGCATRTATLSWLPALMEPRMVRGAPVLIYSPSSRFLCPSNSRLVGVRAAVVMMVMRTHGLQLCRWSAASVGCLAARGLKLNRRMADVEAVAQRAVDAVEDAAGLRHLHLGDDDVAGQRVRSRPQRPDVQVVNVDYSRDRLHGVADRAQLQIARRAFEKNVDCLADDAD